jgi:transcriptional regulator with XRE-family HTH domain
MEKKVNTPNDRFREIRLSFKPKLSQTQFAELLDLSLATIQKIEQGEKISDNVLDALDLKLNVNAAYITTGKGYHFYDDKMPDVSELLKEKTKNSEAGWKVALEAFKESNEHLKGEVKYYRQLLMQVTGGKAAHFLQALNGTGLLKKRSLGAAA